MVSTLIATVTFAAAFTIPGGYGSSDERASQEGMAILARRRAFQVFVLSNMAALYSSIFAATTLIWAHLDDRKLTLTSLDIALPSLTVALAMMLIAFMTGLFVVLHGVCGWLATVVFIMSCAFLPLVLVVLVPLYFPSPSTKNIFARAIFHVTFSFLLLVCDRETKTKKVE
uniref:PGG domain-containing protein n=2 Tax=Opuntia streptacantha TaxID=393608 RepID=A0A7C9CWD8_OPUST